MTTIIQHGTWVRYEPEQSIGNTLWGSVIYCRREADGIDWYMFQKSNILQPDSVKMTAQISTFPNLIHPPPPMYVIQAVTRDITRLFPADALLLELIGVDDLESQLMNNYSQRTFDPQTNRIGDNIKQFE